MQNGNTAEIETRFKGRQAAFAERGARGLWQAMLDEQNESPSRSPYNTARLYARLGDTNAALAWLARSHQERENGDGVDPLMDDCWDMLRSDPRYKQLMETMGFTKVIQSR
jgi:hypothetical protein